ncbi:MAG: Hsp20/alpha crystallin family protein [Candidatus Helarchaeota archaeon]
MVFRRLVDDLIERLDDEEERLRKKFKTSSTISLLKEGFDNVKNAIGGLRDEVERITGLDLGKKDIYLNDVNKLLKFFDLNPPFPEIDQVGNYLQVEIDVPGFSKENLDLNCAPKRIRIFGKVPFNGKTREINKVISLPKIVDPTKADAELRNGVLTIKIPIVE